MLLFVPILFLFFPRAKKKNVYPKKKKRIRLLRSASTHFVRFSGSPRFARDDGINTSTKLNGNLLPL